MCPDTKRVCSLFCLFLFLESAHYLKYAMQINFAGFMCLCIAHVFVNEVICLITASRPRPPVWHADKHSPSSICLSFSLFSYPRLQLFSFVVISRYVACWQVSHCSSQSFEGEEDESSDRYCRGTRKSSGNSRFITSCLKGRD